MNFNVADICAAILDILDGTSEPEAHLNEQHLYLASQKSKALEFVYLDYFLQAISRYRTEYVFSFI